MGSETTSLACRPMFRSFKAKVTHVRGPYTVTVHSTGGKKQVMNVTCQTDEGEYIQMALWELDVDRLRSNIVPMAVS